jgi:predicted ATPase
MEGATRAPFIEYRFKHDLVQEVAYNSLLVRKRREIHQAVGEAIETVYSDNIDQVQEILAYHFSKSNDSQKAYIYMKQSGAKNTRNSSLWEAFRFYKQALALNLDTPEDEGLETRLQMASAMISLGFPEDSLEILKQAEESHQRHQHDRALLLGEGGYTSGNQIRARLSRRGQGNTRC